MIKDSVTIAGNISNKIIRNDIYDFSVLEFFGIGTRSSKARNSIQVVWEFPSLGWFKVNTDGASRGSPGSVTCVEI